MDVTLAQARQLYQQARQNDEQAGYQAALEQYQQALAVFEQALGPDHPETARCRAGLGGAFNALSDFDTARQLVEQAIAVQRQLLRKGGKAAQLDPAASLQILAEIVTNQGDLMGGVPLIQEAYQLRQRVLGPFQAETLESLSLWALVLVRLGQGEYAEGLLLQAHDHLPPDLASAADTPANLGRAAARVLTRLAALWAAQKPPNPRARPLYDQALALSERFFGAQHPYTAMILNNLGALLADLDEAAAAEPLLVRSLQLHEQAYGVDSPFTAFVLVNLAGVYQKLERPRAAYPLLERALIIFVRSLGPLHPQCLVTLRKWVVAAERLPKAGSPGADPLAQQATLPLYQCMMGLTAAAGELDPGERNMPGASLDPQVAAQRLHEEVERLAAGRAKPPLTAGQQAALEAARQLAARADALHRQGDNTAALAHLEQALAAQEDVLGLEHLDHIPLLQQLSEVKAALGDYSAALPLAERILAIHERVLGPLHPHSLSALTGLWSLYVHEYSLEEALPLQRQIVERHEQSLGVEDYNVRILRSHLSSNEARAQGKPVMIKRRLSRSQRYEQALAGLPAGQLQRLAGLEQVDWRSLQHAYGPAVDVPFFLRLLLSDDPELVVDAWEELLNRIYHQGSCYPATAAVVPFFLQLLPGPEPPARLDVLSILADLSGDDLRMSELGDDAGSEAAWFVQVGEAVAAGLEQYWALLQDPDRQMRLQAVRLLANLRHPSAEIRARLLARLPEVSDPAERAGIIYALRRHMANAPAAQRLFLDLAQPGEDAGVVFQALAGWLERAVDVPASDVAGRLRGAAQALQTSQPEETVWLPWLSPEDEMSPVVREILELS